MDLPVEDEKEILNRDLDSTLESVDAAEILVTSAAEQAGFEEDDLHKIGMAVRECMVNAVVHGNRYSAHKKVHLVVTGREGLLTIRIADEGEGFELSELPDPLAEENLLRRSGRGVFLIRAFMDDVQFRKLSPHGTEVTLVKKVVREDSKT
jgi:serine/threonine-protein kinase RsbW